MHTGLASALDTINASHSIICLDKSVPVIIRAGLLSTQVVSGLSDRLTNQQKLLSKHE